MATSTAQLESADLPRWLEQRLRSKLPGRPAQARFEPELSYGRHFGPASCDARPAAVVALLYRDAGTWHLPLTVRAAGLTAHAGQISLPGGAVELDETSHAAALRELEEELAVDRGEVELLGRLTPLYLFASNFVVEPWVAWMPSRPAFVPDAREVAELLEVPLPDLLDRSRYGTHCISRGGLAFTAPHIVWQRHRVWGATSMILGELIAVLQRDEETAPRG